MVAGHQGGGHQRGVKSANASCDQMGRNETQPHASVAPRIDKVPSQERS
jgi:hypothetical protein